MSTTRDSDHELRVSDHELAVDAIMAAFGDGLPATRALVSDLVGCAEILASDWESGWDRARAFLAEHAPPGRS